MPRIAEADPAALGADAKALLAKLPPLNIFKLLANAESLLGPYVRLGDALLRKCTLDPLLREMAIIRVGHLSNAAYEIFQHERIARTLGMPETKIMALKRGAQSSAFSLPEKAVLRFTDDVVTNVRAGDASFAGAAQFLDPRQMVELDLTIGYYMLTCRLLETFDVTIEPEGVTQGLNLNR